MLDRLSSLGIFVLWLKRNDPRTPNQLAKLIADIATGEADQQPTDTKNAAAVALGRLGGLKGGAARASKLTPEQRSEIAKKAAAKRWGEK